MGNNGSSWFAFLGGYNSLNEYFYQDVSIPSNAASAELNFNYTISTDETTLTKAYDTMTVQLVDPVTGSTLATLKTLSNLDFTTDWVMSQTFDLLAYKGRTLRVKFAGATDVSLPTIFLVDDAKVMVTGPGDVTAPTVTSNLPANGATNVAVTSTIKATFSESMTASAINSATFSLSPPVSGTVSYDSATKTATLTPSTSLAPNTSYTTTISSSVKDTAGNPMSANKTWSFQTASGGPLSNLLANSDFEAGHAGWTETNSAGRPNINLNAGLGHGSSDWYIYTGSVNSLTSATFQDVNIPADVSNAYLQFWYRITSDEVTSTSRYDTMDVQVVSPTSGTVLKTLRSYSNLDETSGWVQSSQYNVTPYRGQSIRLKFLVSTDNSNPTYFRIDDVSLMATADGTPPNVTTFTLPATATSLTVPITSFTATDNVAVTGYLVTESGIAPAATITGWLTSAPASFNFVTPGAKTLFAWAKDAAGNVSLSKSVSVTITVGTYTLSYAAGANGSISGVSPQTVSSGGSGSQVTAVPNTGHHFVSWSDGVATASRTETNVTGSVSVTASFAANSYTLTFTAGTNGSLAGTTSQNVNYSASASAVNALPTAGYHLANWTGTGGFVTSTVNPLTVTNVSATQTITANFTLIDGILTPAQGKTRPDIGDALHVLQIAIGQSAATANDLTHADIAPLGAHNTPIGDGIIDIYDVIGILRMTVGLI